MAVNERFDFSGISVVITGGGKGIGKVYAEEFAKVGAKVVAADIDAAAAATVAATLRQAGFEAIGLGVDIASEAACNRPDRTGIKSFKQGRVRHEPGHAAVAVQKRVHPDKTVMGGGGGDDGFRLAQMPVGLFKTFQKARQCRSADGNMHSDRDVVVAELSRIDPDTLPRSCVFHP